ncbi:MAG TPA: VOC family protein [Candidatus Binataceae bacterium]|nr:VOC family protein [Candidatus Binataceae bacterium]
MNNLRHFAIPADDVERAKRFYERVFKWRIEAWGPPDFYLIFTDEADKPHGSIDRRDDLAAARSEQTEKGRGGIGWECTIAVDDLSAIKSAIVKHGGKIVHDEREIVGVGTLIRFADTEGNIACAMHYVV